MRRRRMRVADRGVRPMRHVGGAETSVLVLRRNMADITSVQAGFKSEDLAGFVGSAPRAPPPRVKPLSDHGITRASTLASPNQSAKILTLPVGKQPDTGSRRQTARRTPCRTVSPRFPTSEALRATTIRLRTLHCEQLKGRSTIKTPKAEIGRSKELAREVLFAPLHLTFNSFDRSLALHLRRYRCSR